ncbi:hypothetical protein F2P81_021247 [Scophthalmus maximus]|uniref:Uncharacterized protein n=1 Tax=Scophthalmus maximus TaxID=52904 RepID=A0A6A4S4E5_SCOMX|nr:hypothetical protein F2P81_021247 [Scophthalmus maximus]
MLRSPITKTDREKLRYKTGPLNWRLEQRQQSRRHLDSRRNAPDEHKPHVRVAPDRSEVQALMYPTRRDAVLIMSTARGSTAGGAAVCRLTRTDHARFKGLWGLVRGALLGGPC